MGTKLENFLITSSNYSQLFKILLTFVTQCLNHGNKSNKHN